jgi:hypothetical protein
MKKIDIVYAIDGKWIAKMTDGRQLDLQDKELDTLTDSSDMRILKHHRELAEKNRKMKNERPPRASTPTPSHLIQRLFSDLS